MKDANSKDSDVESSGKSDSKMVDVGDINK